MEHPFLNVIFLNDASVHLAAGLPSAIAAKLVKPDTPVVAIVGDGGFMMNSQASISELIIKLFHCIRSGLK